MKEGNGNIGDLCCVCGEDAVGYLGKEGSVPLCQNIVCYHTAIGEINKMLKEVKNEDSEVVDVSND